MRYVRLVLIDGPARLVDHYVPLGHAYLPTRWDRHVPKVLTIPWLFLKTYLVLAGGFAVAMYYLDRLGLPSLWPH
jgi:hypothetical protein